MEESVASFRLSAWPYGIAWNFTTLGWIATDQGRLDDARWVSGRVAATCFVIWAPRCALSSAWRALCTSQWPPWISYRRSVSPGRTAAQRHELGVARSPGDLAALEPRLRLAQQPLGKSKAAAEWAQGATMSLDEAVESVLAAASVIGASSARRARVQVLTVRESEVAAAVRAGPRIGRLRAQLVIAERTVETHLERIYSKWDIHSRLQLAAWVAHQQSNGQ